MKLELPKIMKELHLIEVDYADGDGIDFEPFSEFYSKEESAEFMRSWTGNSELDGSEYLLFGQDGSGGMSAFWLIRNVENILQQPIVFFGSEGELVVVAQSFKDYVWLLASGNGASDAQSDGCMEQSESQRFKRFAMEHYPDDYRSCSDIVKSANSEFPDFESMLVNLCRY